MRVLYIAEIVGKPGVYCVKTVLSRLRKERGIDFVIANGDGATGGFGIGKNHSIYLRKLGVDVITGGDQTFFKKDIAEHIEKAYHMLRPANLPPEMPGRGWRHYTVTPAEWAAVASGGVSDAGGDASSAANAVVGETATTDGTDARDATDTPDGATPVSDGAGRTLDTPDKPDGAGPAPDAAAAEPDATATKHAGRDDTSSVSAIPTVKIGVVNLIGQSGFDRIHGGNPYTYLKNVLERITKESVAVIVDFHALTTAEKYTMFHYLDGSVTAVIGSGQRVQTADAHVMASGTAVICDAGRTGSQNSVSGLLPDPEIKKYLTRIPKKSEETWESLELQGVLLDIDPANGYVTAFEAIREACPQPPENAKGKNAAKGKSAGKNGKRGERG